MKRSRIRRFNPETGPKWLERGTRLKSSRKKSRTIRTASGERVDKKAAQFGRQAMLCQNMPCRICAASVYERMGTAAVVRVSIGLMRLLYDPVSQAHHEPTVARGGLDKDTIPLCRHHHIEDRHRIGYLAFVARHGVDPIEVAAEIHAALQAAQEAA